MKSDKAKVLHSILGRPLAWYPVTRAIELGAQHVVAVVGHQADAVQSTLGALFQNQPLRFALQKEQRGTGDAVASARASLNDYAGPVLILYGDVPLLTRESLQSLLDVFRKGGGPLAMITTRPADPTGYGRIVRDSARRVQRVVEHKDATEDERAIGEVNAGIYVADSKFLWQAIDRLTPQNAQGELYLTDIVSQAAALGSIAVVEAPAAETEGINDRVELAERCQLMRKRINERHMRLGVTLIDPASTFIDEGVEIGPDTILGPQVSIQGDCEIGANATIGQGAILNHSTVGDGTEIRAYSVLEEAVVGPRSIVGPFARLRPGTVLDESVHIGNFVETKKAHLRKGSKANHLAYLGDAEIGSNCNIGAGTITCNYDGVNKYVTTLGDGVFIGSDSQLVAPVRIGNGAFVGAGTTITEDVPAGALAVSRTPQTNKEGWAERRRKVLAGRKGE